MGKGRMEAFSDGVIAIIITIMVLELKPPHGHSAAALRPVLPIFLSYALSFVYVGIYWNNHHHLLQAAHRVSGGILWANLHLLFWLSLTPFATAWMGESPLSSLPVALYGAVLLLSGFAYYILTRRLVKQHGHDSVLASSVGRDWKTKASVAVYAASIALAFWSPVVACGGYVLVALVWLLPDSRIENAIGNDQPRASTPE